jgi:hypothetical protein
VQSFNVFRLACLVSVLVLLASCGGSAARVSPGAGPAAPRSVSVAPGQEAPLPSDLDSAPARTLDQIAFEFSWDLRLPGQVHLSLIDPDIPDLLLLQLTTGEIHGIEARSGMTRFVTEPLADLLEFPIDVVRRKRIVRDRSVELSEFDDRFYCVGQSKLYCFEAEAGHLVWSYDLPFEPSSGARVEGGADNERIFIGDWAGRVRVVSFDADRETPFVVWQWSLQGGVPQAPGIGVEDLIYIPDMKGRLSCFNLDRDLKWTFQGHGALYAPPAIRGRSLYLGADDNVLHVINRLSGARLGSLYLDAPVRRQPMIFDNMPTTLYAWTDGPQGGLHAVHAEPDQVEFTDVAEPRFPLEVERLARKWFVPELTRIVGSSPRQLYCTATESSQVIAIDKKTGNLDWRWDLIGTLGSRPTHIVSYVDHGDLLKSIFAVGADGHMVAYRIFGQYTR